jgi:hypothetical protein
MQKYDKSPKIAVLKVERPPECTGGLPVHRKGARPPPAKLCRHARPVHTAQDADGRSLCAQTVTGRRAPSPLQAVSFYGLNPMGLPPPAHGERVGTTESSRERSSRNTNRKWSAWRDACLRPALTEHDIYFAAARSLTRYARAMLHERHLLGLLL